MDGLASAGAVDGGSVVSGKEIDESYGVLNQRSIPRFVMRAVDTAWSRLLFGGAALLRPIRA
ncbi:hypothetical protein GCM10025857_31400 [Alicyclobacillus contaminans]|nr:hypothetical protein GCM10025857_31400 [Alicyclobacillus contaminans]